MKAPHAAARIEQIIQMPRSNVRIIIKKRRKVCPLDALFAALDASAPRGASSRE